MSFTKRVVSKEGIIRYYKAYGKDIMLQIFKSTDAFILTEDASVVFDMMMNGKEDEAEVIIQQWVAEEDS